MKAAFYHNVTILITLKQVIAIQETWQLHSTPDVGYVTLTLPAATACGKVTNPVIPVAPNIATFLIESDIFDEPVSHEAAELAGRLWAAVAVGWLWLSKFGVWRFHAGLQGGVVVAFPGRKPCPLCGPKTDSSQPRLSLLKEKNAVIPQLNKQRSYYIGLF